MLASIGEDVGRVISARDGCRSPEKISPSAEGIGEGGVVKPRAGLCRERAVPRGPWPAPEDPQPLPTCGSAERELENRNPPSLPSLPSVPCRGLLVDEA